ncbi:MAG: hypothetical protein EOP36_08585 [Rubrivivax sp.]|nr:MAG: hypothetical protein EOP36_08585 [Rubrivivax sp.]
MKLSYAVLAIAGLGSTLCAHAATTAPTANLGSVSSFATFVDNDARSYAQLYDRQLTFSIANDATVRIDMREVGNTHWLNEYAHGLVDVNLTLLNSSQQLLGTASIDPSFNGSNASCGSGFKCNVSFAKGYTLTTTLAAGTYTMELTGKWLSSNASPLNFGVLVVGAADQAAYLTAFTPATNLPEPTSWALMALGFCGVAAATKAKRQA